MKQLLFSYDHSGVSPDELKKIQQKLMPTITHIAGLNRHDYTTPYASLSLPFDTTMHQQVATLVTAKKKLQPSLLLVIGIGGSNLATIALWQALQSIAATVPVHFYCADSVDADYTQALYTLLEKELQVGRVPCIVVVSKSGTTTETIANAQLFTALLARYKKNYAEYIVIISDEGSVLWQKGQQENIACLAIPQLVGGRFSVFSPVSLFPLGLLGIDTKVLLAGATSAMNMIRTFDQNPAAMNAAILCIQYQKGLVIHDSFFFCTAMEGIGRWYRQLVAESIGKLNKQRQRVGITPTVSIGSVDLHSMVQLYLAGLRNRMTTFITVSSQSTLQVPSQSPLQGLLPMINGKQLREIMAALLAGTQKAYSKEKLPFITCKFPELSAYLLGQYMQLKMIEIMYIGALLDVNPFDQPQVELYKEETRKILAHG